MNHSHTSITHFYLGVSRWISYKVHNPTLGTSACWPNSHCTNSVGSFDCSCDTGWTIDIVELDNCVDIDEDRLRTLSDVHDVILDNL